MQRPGPGPARPAAVLEAEGNQLADEIGVAIVAAIFIKQVPLRGRAPGESTPTTAEDIAARDEQESALIAAME